jgi:ribosomal protein S27AE
MMVQPAYESRIQLGSVNVKLSRPNCPQCGSMLLVAEESCFGVGGRIDHSRSCDDCGNKFLTSIRLWRR